MSFLKNYGENRHGQCCQLDADGGGDWYGNLYCVAHDGHYGHSMTFHGFHGNQRQTFVVFHSLHDHVQHGYENVGHDFGSGSASEN